MTTEIVKRTEESAPSLFGTADPRGIVSKATEVADVLATVLRERGLALRFGDSQRDFLTWHGWQVLASQMGVTTVLEWTRPLADRTGWEARAEVRTLDGRIIGAGESMCTRHESRWKAAADYAVRSMAQVRASRRALQSCLGFIPGLAGLDLSDPDAPATRKQVGTLHAITKTRGWSHEESHARAGVESFNDLTRVEAAALIDEWSSLEVDAADAGATSPDVAPSQARPSGDPQPPHPFAGGQDGIGCHVCGWAVEHPVHGGREERK
jgi:hypothetical protein